MMINNITFENPMLGVGIFVESDGQFFKAETKSAIGVSFKIK